jgi:hypothetical protein
MSSGFLDSVSTDANEREAQCLVASFQSLPARTETMQRAQGVAPRKQSGGWRTMKANPLRARAWQGGYPRR